MLGKYEPVRRYIYGLLGPVLTAMLVHGIISDSQATAYFAIAAAILGVGATEAARAQVTPVRKRDDYA